MRPDLVYKRKTHGPICMLLHSASIIVALHMRCVRWLVDPPSP